MGSKAFATLIALTLALVASVEGQTRYQAVIEDGVSWFKDSAGHRLFSFGVCVVDTGTKFEDYDVKNPGYAAWRFYASKPDWAAAALETLRSGGFNTVGAWSEYLSLLHAPGNKILMTPIIHNGSSAGFPWTDMWDPALVKVSDDVAKGLIESLGRDPRIIGYFSDNELGWWRPALFEWVWKQKTHYTRTRVIELLKKRYHGSWAALSAEFDPVDAGSWKELGERGKLCLRPGAKGQPAIGAVLRMLAERYYSLCRAEIKRYDPGALYLGDRYISNYYPEVAAAAGRYCDVVSTNLNPNWGDGGFVRYHLSGLEKLTHKPLMVTEYYMSAAQNRSGNKNDRSGFPVVETLAERAAGFRNTTTAFLATPYLVGAHWFQYYDEPRDGRGDGENYNFGLVDVNNVPYSELLEAGKALDLEALHAQSRLPASAGDGMIPPMAQVKTSGRQPSDLSGWDRDRAFIESDSAIPRGDCYAAWEPDGLDLSLFWSEERFTENYFRDGKVPAGDETTVTVEIPGQIKWVRLIKQNQPMMTGDPWNSLAKLDSASWLVVKIPAAALGSASIHAGQELAFRITLISQTRAYTTTWTIHRRVASH